MRYVYHTFMMAVLLTLTASTATATQVPITHEDTTSRAYQLGKLLRCPVCQGMPIAESPTTMARNMMQKVRQLIVDGQTNDQIISFFTARYGDWVLLKPKAVGLNLGVWLGPVLLLLFFGIWLLLGRFKHRTISNPPAAQTVSTTAIHRELESD